MTAKPRRKPKEPEIFNPRYAGATPEMVGRALLRHAPESSDGETDSEAADTIDKPEVRSSI